MWGLSGIYCLDAKRLYFYCIGRWNIKDNFKFWCHANLIFWNLICVLNLKKKNKKKSLGPSMCYRPVKVKERWRRIFECKAARRAAELPAVFLSFEVSMVGWPYRRVYKHCTECVQSVYKCTGRPQTPDTGAQPLVPRGPGHCCLLSLSTLRQTDGHLALCTSVSQQPACTRH